MKPMTWDDALKLNGTPGYTGRDCLESYEKVREARRQPQTRDRRTWVNLEAQERSCAKHGAFKSVLQRLEGAPDHAMFAPRWTTCPTCDLEIEAEQRENSEASAEMRRALERLRLVNSGMPEMNYDRTYKMIAVTDGRVRAVAEKVKAYCETLEGQIEKGRNLVMYGNPGAGKTMLACIVLRHLLINLGGTGKYYTQSRFVSRLKATMDRNADETEDQAFEELSRLDLVVVDEVGRGSSSDWEKSVLFRLIDERYQRHCKPTILCTNLTKAELEAFLGDAAIDRLKARSSEFLKFSWESMRHYE